MSGTASNYDLWRLYAGIGVALLASTVALSVSARMVLDAGFTGLWMISIAILYGFMMFASSYVEEEQQFWYWATSSWLGWLIVKASVHSQILHSGFHTNHPSHRGTKDGVLPWISAITALALMRIVRRWNQTGQKYAGEPDIARTFLPSHNRVLWLLVLAAYLNITQRLARKLLPGTSLHISAASSIALCVAALGFKVAFTKADAPELLVGLRTDFLRPMQDASLVVQSRVVFLGIGTLVCLRVLSQAFLRSVEGNGKGKLPRCRTATQC